MDLLRAVGATDEGQTFNSLRRIVRIDSRTASRLLKDFRSLGLAESNDGLYRLTARGHRVLAGVARIHMEADAPW